VFAHCELVADDLAEVVEVAEFGRVNRRIDTAC
jgi:hypothetical protein